MVSFLSPALCSLEADCPLILVCCFWTVKRLISVGKQLLDPLNGTVMSFHFPLPATVSRILHQFQLALASTTQAWSICGGRHTLRTAEIQITFAGSFLRETQAMAQLSLCCEEMRLKPSNLVGRALPSA